MARDWKRVLQDPRTAVLLALGGVIGVGGGLRIWRGVKARQSVERINQPAADPADIRTVADFGRAGLRELFEILTDSNRSAAQRDAAGDALAILWRKDELIAEEEKGLIVRGLDVRWTARRRYPRALRVSVPIAVEYGLPFLKEEGSGLRPSDLLWSHRVLGARSADLEVPSPFAPGPIRLVFSIHPENYLGNGPHRLVLALKVRPRGADPPWELEPPQIPFTFELDPQMKADALLTTPDVDRQAALSRSIALSPGGDGDLVPLDEGWSFLAPSLGVRSRPPCDLAGEMLLEFERSGATLPLGPVVIAADAPPATRRLEAGLGPPSAPIGEVGPDRVRVMIRPDVQRGWADPAVRALWPEPFQSDWVATQLFRR